MSKLSMLQQNAYISIVIKDNGIWTHLAYTDFNADREYILSDYTNLDILKFRLDDHIFSKEFWYQYFNTLEKIFNWNIVDKNSLAIFTFRNFKCEGDGISGIRVMIDDNQMFFDNIFQSVRDFSNDVALRVINDQYMQSLLEGVAERLGYDDLMYVDMDIHDFSIFRVTNIYEKDGTCKKLFTKSKLNRGSDFAVIDSINDGRFKVFLSTDLSERELVNYWSNFVIDKPLNVREPKLKDILRSYATILNYSILTDNRSKLERFGNIYEKSGLIVSGYVPSILGKKLSLLTIIDGLELSGEIDCFFDVELRTLSYGKSYVFGADSTDIILTRKEILSNITKIIIPVVDKTLNKVIFSGTVESKDIEKTDFYVLTPQFRYIDLPRHEEKLLIEGECKNGARLPKSKESLSIISVPKTSYYSSILIDGRPRPIVYGPDVYSNKLKTEAWLNDNKA